MTAKKRLFNLADNQCQFWRSFEYDNKQICFDHLIARKLTYHHPTRNEIYTFYITISHHVFTIQTNKSDDQVKPQIYPHKPEDQRYFCPIRYALSCYLPDILATLPKQLCYHGGYSRYCTCKLKDDNGNDIYYQVVFRVWKERGKMRFHVESAYPLLVRPSKMKKVNFWVICHNLSKNKRLPQPPK